MVVGIIILLTVLSVVVCIKVKNQTLRILLGINTIVLLALLLLIGSYVYITRYKIADIDSSVSPDGKYEVIFQSVGEPDWPFGHSHARITLKRSDITIEQFKLDVANDGGVLHPENWHVTWDDTCVIITISGEEQDDVIYSLYYNGDDCNTIGSAREK